jgi:nicotinamidase-related amidase
MQNIFAPGGPWAAPWMARVLPLVEELTARHAARTIFTRFITPRSADEMPGMWQRYYTRWADVTRDRIAPAMLEVVPSLARFAPPATVIDKTRYSAFAAPELLPALHAREASTLIVTGSETDVCVLSTVTAAVDLGFRVIVVTDAICSSSDEGHDAMLKIYTSRFSEQIETADTATLLSAWNA